MNVKELRDLLAQYPDDTLVTVKGHSDGDGFNEIAEIVQLDLIRLPLPTWRGEYSEYRHIIDTDKILAAINIS